MPTQVDQRVPSLSGREALIMELMLARPADEMYGLEMVGRSRGRLKRGTVYVTLSRMEEKGLIQSRSDEAHADDVKLPRRLYRATGFGKRVFEAWEMMKSTLRFKYSHGGAS